MDDFIIELEWNDDYKLMQKMCRDIFNKEFPIVAEALEWT